VWVCYTWSDRVIALLGHRGARIVSRLTAFILLCVGIQIISTGLANLAATILPAIHP
jgi:multiple antibiotic resistance protein